METQETIKLDAPDVYAKQKEEILHLEMLFVALDAGSYPARVAEMLHNGAKYLQRLHAELVSKLPPEEIDKLRNAHKPAVH